MSSRFFKPQFDSDSESEESEQEVQVQRTQPAAAVTYTFSDDDEDPKRVVRTEKQKRYEELDGVIKQIKNHIKIKDISKMLTGFENLTKAFTKAKTVIEKDENGVNPRFYIKCLVEMEDFVNEVWEDREGRKNMSKNNVKSLTTLRQKLRKYNKEFEQEMTSYRESPDEIKNEDDEEENEKSEDESEASDDEGGFVVKGGAKKEREELVVAEDLNAKAAASDDEKDSDESDWGSSSDESSLSSDYETYGESAAFKFLKKDSDLKEPKKREKKKDRKEISRRKIEEDDEEGEWEKVKGGLVTGEKQKVFNKDDEINHETVVKKLNEILSLRGKKRIQRNDQMSMLNELLDIAEVHKLGPGVKAKIIFGITTALMDYNTNLSTCMKPESWEKSLDYCCRLMEILSTTPDFIFSEKITEENESFHPPSFRIHGSIITLIERMDEEFTKTLQAVDAHSPEYIERLKDETNVCKVIDLLQNYLETDSIGSESELCRVYILKIDHLYYKFDFEVFKNKNVKEEGKEESKTKSSVEIMDQLCKFIYAKDSTDRIRTQAILCHIYHHALHDNWFEARDLMLMSHLQGYNISRADVGLQIIYNRALVQLGLCAFRHGNIKDAHTGLLDIQILGRAKEFLAQGLLPKPQERTPEQERLEKRRLLPFHKHINLELLECVYLVSAMLLEIPDVAANEYSVRKKMISRSFYNQLRKNEEQPLVGLPESMREHVVAASKAMRVGNWKACRDFIINDKMNAKVWNLFHNPDKVREMLVQKIREESLRAYLFTFSHIYDSISIETLRAMFDLDHSTVHGIISKMIINEELMASLDEPTQTLVMHRTEPSRLQGLSLQLADKITTLVDHNERIWELKQVGTYGMQTNRLNFGGRQDRMDRQQHGYMERQQQQQQREQRRGSQYNRNQ